MMMMIMIIIIIIIMCKLPLSYRRPLWNFPARILFFLRAHSKLLETPVGRGNRRRTVLWDVTSCSLLDIDRRFGGTCCFHLLWRWMPITAKKGVNVRFRNISVRRKHVALLSENNITKLLFKRKICKPLVHYGLISTQSGWVSPCLVLQFI